MSAGGLGNRLTFFFALLCLKASRSTLGYGLDDIMD